MFILVISGDKFTSSLPVSNHGVFFVWNKNPLSVLLIEDLSSKRITTYCDVSKYICPGKKSFFTFCSVELIEIDCFKSEVAIKLYLLEKVWNNRLWILNTKNLFQP